MTADRIQEVGNPVVCVVGLGKIGLPLAVQCARSGEFSVIGCDISPWVVDSVNAGQAPFDSEEGLAEALEEVVAAGKLRATTDTIGGVRESSVVLVIVPVALTSAFEVDYSIIDAATRAVGTGLQKGSLVIYETTLPVGTTRDRLAKLLEQESGLDAGRDFGLAFSPERVYSGRIFRDLASYPKVVGGIDAASTARTVAFYRDVLHAPILNVGSSEAAEYVKLVETTYRDVNIALANEFALFAEQHGLNIHAVIDAANTQPFSHVHRPSVGVGGHCIPVYPYFLFRASDTFRLPPLARQINDSMASHGIDLLEEVMVGGLSGCTVLLLGLTYRENVKETAFSSAYKVSDELRRRGAVVIGHDPLLTADEQRAFSLEPVPLAPMPAVDAIVLQAYHTAYTSLDWNLFTGLQAMLDGRAALDHEQIDQLEARGVRVLRIGHRTSMHAPPVGR